MTLTTLTFLIFGFLVDGLNQDVNLVQLLHVVFAI